MGRKNRLNGVAVQEPPMTSIPDTYTGPISVLPAVTVAATLLKLDLGCGPNPRDGFEGVDQYPFEGKVKHVADLRKPWPWPDNSVGEAHCSHFLEHLTNFGGLWERVHFFNELHRVLVNGGTAQLIFPHWCSNRYYGDPTHKEPFSEMGFYYLDRGWRLSQAPHSDSSVSPNGYTCDFLATWGYSMHPTLTVRSADVQQFAFQWHKEAAQDVISTLTARK